MAEQVIRCINPKNNKVRFFKKHIVTDSWSKSTGFIPQEVVDTQHTQNVPRNSTSLILQENLSDDGTDKILLEMQEKLANGKQEVLSNLPRGVHEGMEKDTPDESTTEAKGQLQELLSDTSKEGEIKERELQGLSESESGNAPRRLQQTEGSDLALQETSSTTSQAEKSNSDIVVK